MPFKGTGPDEFFPTLFTSTGFLSSSSMSSKVTEMREFLHCLHPKVSLVCEVFYVSEGYLLE
jgi:hypothetical protein